MKSIVDKDILAQFWARMSYLFDLKASKAELEELKQRIIALE